MTGEQAERVGFKMLVALAVLVVLLFVVLPKLQQPAEVQTEDRGGVEQLTRVALPLSQIYFLIVLIPLLGGFALMLIFG